MPAHRTLASLATGLVGSAVLARGRQGRLCPHTWGRCTSCVFFLSALSLAVSLTFRFITGLLLHTLIALVILGLLCKYFHLNFFWVK